MQVWRSEAAQGEGHAAGRVRPGGSPFTPACLLPLTLQAFQQPPKLAPEMEESGPGQAAPAGLPVTKATTCEGGPVPAPAPPARSPPAAGPSALLRAPGADHLTRAVLPGGLRGGLAGELRAGGQTAGQSAEALLVARRSGAGARASLRAPRLETGSGLGIPGAAARGEA